MSSLPPVRLVICGAAGFIGKRHVGYAMDNPDVDLVAIVDPTPAGETLGKELEIPCFKNVEALFANSPTVMVDAALVATPSATHESISIAFLNRGIHTLVEKPISIDSESAKRILAAGKSGNAQIMVGHHRRLNPFALAAKAEIDSGKLGRIVALTAIWATRKPDDYFSAVGWRQQYKSGGPLLTNMIHEIDVLRYLLGDVKRVFVQEGLKTRPYEVEETIAFTMEFVSGAVGTFLMSDAALSPWTWEQGTDENPEFPKTGQNVYQIFGTRGSMAVPDLVRWHKDGKSDGASGDWFDALDKDHSAMEKFQDENPYPIQMARLVDVVRGKAQPACSAEDGIRALQLVEAMFVSMETRGPVDIELQPL